MEQVELTMKEVQNIQWRNQRMKEVQKEAQKLQNDYEIMQREYNMYLNELYDKYGLDLDEDYKLENGALTKVEDVRTETEEESG